MVMGNICLGHKAQVGRSAKSHEGNKVDQQAKGRKRCQRDAVGKGKETEK